MHRFAPPDPRRTRARFPLPRFAGALAAAACLLAATGAARADNVDKEMARAARCVMADLKAQGYKNVGVLRFRVQRPGDKEARFDTGVLNSAMATRLENALAVVDDVQPPIGITRNAGEVAARRSQKVSYRQAADRAKLFDLAYPLAWGEQKVRVDAFLTGVVEVLPGMRQSKILIERFDKKSDLHKITAFTVTNDPGTLADLAVNFTLRKRAANIKLKDEEVPEVVIPHPPRRTNPPSGSPNGDVETRAEGTLPPPKSDSAKQIPGGTPPAEEVRVPNDKADQTTKQDSAKDYAEPAQLPVTLEVYYDGKRVPVRDQGIEKQIKTPQEGQKVHFILTNQSDSPMYATVLVNGMNTLSKQQDQALMNWWKWVLPPHHEQKVEGFFGDDKTWQRFEVHSPDQVSEISEDHLGVIQLFVFAPTGDAPLPAGDQKLTTKGVNWKELAHASAKPATLAKLQGQIAKSAGRVRTKNVIVPGDARPGEVEEVEAPPLTCVGEMAFRYYNPR
jgi:hypothetical protein